MRYQIYEAKSVKYDAQQRVGVITMSLGISDILYPPEKGTFAQPEKTQENIRI